MEWNIYPAVAKTVLAHRRSLQCNLLKNITRCLYSKTGKWVTDFSVDVREEMESHWKVQLQKRNAEQTLSKKDERAKFYILSMFPYPSGQLHMGHVRVYTIGDSVAHFHRMNGKQVLHPMGWDAFGLPAENAAIERQLKPDDWTYSNIDIMRKQLLSLGMCFNWDREVTTCNQDYYRWTQSIFVKLYGAGLAYQKESLVNWDPVDQTVLAEEQVDDMGCSWRSGAQVQQKLLKQWFLRMTHFSKSLLDGLNELPYWPSGIKSMQANWIGDCSGCTFRFTIQIPSVHLDKDLVVHTFHPDLIYGVSHIVLAPTHLVLRKKEFLDCLDDDVLDRVKEIDTRPIDVNLNVFALHPLTHQPVGMIASSRGSFQDGTDSRLVIPSSCAADQELAELCGLPYERVLDSSRSPALLINSGQFSGLTRETARDAIMQHARRLKVGGHMTSPRQFDWLISRQRYWGTPIPIIHCPKCKTVPVPEDQLPVPLPELETLTGKGASPLAEVTDWVNVMCPRCQGPAQRETDTMDTFVDSSWYFLRYTDACNREVPFGKQPADWLMPVDLYVGGKEHAIMHLLYARFINHFLHDQGLVSHKEPFTRLLTQGLVMGRSYRSASTGQYVRPNQVDNQDGEPVQKGTREKLVMKWEKMSKSKHNGVDPQETVRQYGIDTVRLFILSGVPPEHDMPWNIDRITRWKNRLWSLVAKFIDLRNQQTEPEGGVGVGQMTEYDVKLKRLLDTTIREVTDQFTRDYMLSVAITRLMTLTNSLRRYPDDAIIRRSRTYEEALCALCIMLAPMAPLVSSEMWAGVAGVPYHLSTGHDWDQSVLDQAWPTVGPEIDEEKNLVEITVKVNNKIAETIPVQAELLQNEEELKRLVLDSDLVQEVIGQRDIKHVIVVTKASLVNVVVDSRS